MIRMIFYLKNAEFGIFVLFMLLFYSLLWFIENVQ